MKIHMKLFKKKHNSQFLKGCDTDWNLNIEFIHWLRYWCIKFLENAKIVDLTLRRIEFKGQIYTQEDAIEVLINLCDEFFESDCYWLNERKSEMIVDEIFDLFHKLFWYMWW